jgi:hypothetical protein
MLGFADSQSKCNKNCFKKESYDRRSTHFRPKKEYYHEIIYEALPRGKILYLFAACKKYFIYADSVVFTKLMKLS